MSATVSPNLENIRVQHVLMQVQPALFQPRCSLCLFFWPVRYRGHGGIMEAGGVDRASKLGSGEAEVVGWTEASGEEMEESLRMPKSVKIH